MFSCAGTDSISANANAVDIGAAVAAAIGSDPHAALTAKKFHIEGSNDMNSYERHVYPRSAGEEPLERRRRSMPVLKRVAKKGHWTKRERP